MQLKVNNALDNAVDNGFDMDRMSPLAIAQDLVLFCEQFETIKPEKLVPYVKVWLRREQKTT